MKAGAKENALRSGSEGISVFEMALSPLERGARKGVYCSRPASWAIAASTLGSDLADAMRAVSRRSAV